MVGRTAGYRENRKNNAYRSEYRRDDVVKR